VIEVSAKDAEALRGRGLAYLHLHEHNAAIADLTAAIAINPTDVRAYRYRALAYEGKNDLRHEDLDDATIRRLDPKGQMDARH
jgi:regulator of sirC expression with transglutaminase-like and TPR domain